MTTKTYVNNTLMAYVGADADVVGVSSATGMPVWLGGQVFFLQAAGANPGLRQFDIDGGDETLQRSSTSIGVFSISSAPGAACVTPDGTKLHFISHFSNSVEVAQVRASDLVLTGTFGAASGSLAPSTSSRILAMDKMVSSPSSNLLVCATQLSTQEIDEISESFGPTANTNCGVLDTAPAIFAVLVGPGGANEAYLLGLPWRNGTTTSTGSMSLYRLTTGALVKIGSITPANIDATWTHFFRVAGIAYDASDGNLLIGVQTTDAVSNQQYIVKLNATTAAVMWTRAITLLTPYPHSFTFSRVNGKYHYLDGASLARHINTADGSQTTETVTGLSSTSLTVQLSDDTTNSVIFYGHFTAGASPPDYVGSVMGVGGNHNLTAWMRLWFATAGGGGGGDGGNRGGLTLSRKRAWTYTQDGHTFYVLDLSTEGTWVYDLTTKQWSQFQTVGSGQWDVQAGTQWNSIRIVGGDLTTTDMWELVPSALQDHDGAADIAHIVTGALQTRSRNYNSVESVVLTGSSNKIGNPTSSAMLLRWSDDNGVTWNAYYSVPLTAGVVTEVAWRSLGAFALPGRIFEVSDSGGMVRIDGMDCFTPDFDDDSSGQQGG